MRVGSDFFDLTDRFKPASAQAGRQLVISVPKRLLRSAVGRNTVKRLVREAWRSALAAGEPDAGSRPSGAILVRLHNLPLPHGTTVTLAPRRKSAAAQQRKPATAAVRVHLAPAASAGGREWRRLLRADVDGLLGRFCGRDVAKAAPSAR